MTTVAALKECNICHKENDNLKETKRSIKEWYKMTHEIKLLQADIEDQAMLGEQFHHENEVRQKIIDQRKEKENYNTNT